MSEATLASGKGHRDENFPVASWLLKAEHRPPVMAFYRFARAADDIADHERASAAEKLARLDAMRRGLDGGGLEGEGAPEAMALARTMRERAIDPVHAHELLDAFVQDVRVDRYADWDALIGYCRLSAMPVGRFVLDVHREDPAVWPWSDALCAALQIVNHLQDCGKDWRTLGRCYLPLDLVAAEGADIGDLGGAAATPALRRVIATLAARTRGLLRESAGFAGRIADRRLAIEVAVIQRLAEDLADQLCFRDPLSERVHHRTGRTLLLSAQAMAAQVFARRA